MHDTLLHFAPRERSLMRETVPTLATEAPSCRSCAWSDSWPGHRANSTLHQEEEILPRASQRASRRVWKPREDPDHMRQQLAEETPKEGLDVKSTFFILHPARRRGCVKPYPRLLLKHRPAEAHGRHPSLHLSARKHSLMSETVPTLAAETPHCTH